MKLPGGIIEWSLRRHEVDEATIEEVLRDIANAEDIDGQRRRIESAEVNEKIRAREFRAHQESLREALRATCPHPKAAREYHEDPAGGSDSHTTCGLCGGKLGTDGSMGS